MLVLTGKEFQHTVLVHTEVVALLEHSLQSRLDPRVEHSQQPPSVDQSLDFIIWQ